MNGSLTRTYATDDIGRIMEVCDPDCATGTVYLPTWNGHGDVLGLWRQNADGTLTLANSYTYGTWGTPSTTVAPGFADLHFRFLYVGASDVQWDASQGVGRQQGPRPRRRGARPLRDSTVPRRAVSVAGWLVRFTWSPATRCSDRRAAHP